MCRTASLLNNLFTYMLLVERMDEAVEYLGVKLDIGVAQRKGAGIMWRQEDTCIVQASTGTFGVWDGAGGMGNGDVASQTVALAMVAYLKELAGADKAAEALMRVFMRETFWAGRMALHDILATGQHTNWRMSTTATILQIARDKEQKPQAIIGHISDSVAYRIRGGQIKKLTQRTKTMFVSAHVQMSDLEKDLGLYQEDLLAGDMYVLATDRLPNSANEGKIMAIISAHQNSPAQVIAEALNGIEPGKNDDGSVIVLKCV